MSPPEETNETQPNQEGSNNKERLMIHKIVNEDFKSYAGVQELGPFHKVSTSNFISFAVDQKQFSK